MNLQCIAEHTIDLDLLKGGAVIDAGCLGFGFSIALAHLNCDVYAFDVQPMASPLPQITFNQAAISNRSGVTYYKPCADKQATHLAAGGIEVGMVDINQWMAEFDKDVEILKLDIEGSEAAILMDPYFKPIPKQISFELHQHTHARLTDEQLDQLWYNLDRWYTVVHCDYSRKHGLCENYWDVLAIKKYLL